MQKLNENLLKFAGFTSKKHPSGNWLMWYEELSNHKRIYYDNKPPDLVNSLDAQAKWIYPKLQKIGYTISLNMYECSGCSCDIANIITNIKLTTYDNNLSVSFALAVEKLIDSMEKK